MESTKLFKPLVRPQVPSFRILSQEVPTGAVGKAVQKKPAWCFSNCPLGYQSAGFVEDWFPKVAKLAVMTALPSKEDVVDGVPFSGGLGRFFYAAVMRELGLTKDDVAFTNVLRCYNREFPVAADGAAAKHACRQYDRVNSHGYETLAEWEPNWFSLTFSLGDMVETGAYYKLGLADFRKALRFAAAGYRPLMLLGSEAAFLVAPWLEGRGGVKAWRGHYWEGDWKFVEDSARRQQENRVFAPARRPVNFWKKVNGKKKPAVQQELFS